MTEPCLELVVFKVRDAEKAALARRAAQQLADRYQGFISWSAYTSMEDTGLFADLVLWRDQSSAKAAAYRLREDPGFAALMAEIDGLVTMSRFSLDHAAEVRAAAA